MSKFQLESVLRGYVRMLDRSTASDFEHAIFDGRRLLGRVWSLEYRNGCAVLI